MASEQPFPVLSLVKLQSRNCKYISIEWYENYKDSNTAIQQLSSIFI